MLISLKTAPIPTLQLALPEVRVLDALTPESAWLTRR